MKTQNRNPTAKSRSQVLLAALVIGLLMATQSSKAQDTVTATFLSGGMSGIIAPGGSFTLTLAVSTNFNSLGYTVFLQSLDGAGLFTITGRTNLSTVFTDPTTPDGMALGNPNGILNPSNARDLGFTGDGFTFEPPGTFQLVTFTISVGFISPNGVYHITLDPRSIMTNPAFQDVAMGGNPVFTVCGSVGCVPEPTTVASLVVGGSFLILLAGRKQRGRGFTEKRH